MDQRKAKIWHQDEMADMSRKFDECSLPESQWTHHAHIVMCAWNLLNMGYYESILKVKIGIAKYNESLGNTNTIERGYHETITIFWIWVINGYLNHKGKDKPIERINQLLQSSYADKYLPFYFYSEDFLFSKKARVMWVEPDKRELDFQLIENGFTQSIWSSD